MINLATLHISGSKLLFILRENDSHVQPRLVSQYLKRHIGIYSNESTKSSACQKTSFCQKPTTSNAGKATTMLLTMLLCARSHVFGKDSFSSASSNSKDGMQEERMVMIVSHPVTPRLREIFV